MKLYGFMLLLGLLFITPTIKAQNDLSWFDTGNGSAMLDYQLIDASDKGDTSLMKQLLSEGANVNATTANGVTSLMYAAQNGNIDAIRILISNGAKPDMKPYNGFTALISAIRAGYLDAAEALIRDGADINLGDNDGFTPLMYAIAVDSFFMGDMLLYYGADVNARDNKGVTPLMVASGRGSYSITKELIEDSAQINIADNNGNTPLHYAVTRNDMDIMDLLIQNGADINVKSSGGYSPLSLATQLNEFDAAALLIGYGANVNSRVSCGLNPLTIAKENKNDSLTRMLRNNNARIAFGPAFNRISAGCYFNANTRDMGVGFNVGISDIKYHLWFTIGYGFRPKAIHVLEKVNENTYSQYWEKRSMFSADLDKGFYLVSLNNTGKLGAFAGFSEIFTFGGYRGTTDRPDHKFLFCPRIGAVFDYGFLRTKLGYEYINLHLYKVNSGRVYLSLEFLINRRQEKLKRYLID